jgi:hypothetical protein
VADFDSGQPLLNDYLRHDALRHGRIGFTRTWVIPDADDDSV